MLDAKSTWNYPTTSSSYTAINQYAQNFVNTVRATGGNNAKRNLIVNTYAAANGGTWNVNCNYVLSKFVVPTDIVSNHIAVEVHSYNPWNWDVNHGKWTTSCESEIKQMMTRLNTYFVSKGTPVIIGEYAATNIDSASVKTDVDQAEGVKYATCVVGEAMKYNIATYYWMGLMDKGDRTSLTWTEPKIKDAIVKAWYGDSGPSTGIKAITK
jgi:hypothetical protein